MYRVEISRNGKVWTEVASSDSLQIATSIWTVMGDVGTQVRICRGSAVVVWSDGSEQLELL